MIHVAHMLARRSRQGRIVTRMRTRLEEIFATLVDDDVPVSFRGYDGSATGPRDPIATVEVCSPEAVRFIATAPGQLGLARAYVSGAVEVQGDLYAALRALHEHRRRDISLGKLLRLLRGFDPRMLRRPPSPGEEAPPAWRRGLHRHSKRRDAAAIAHHYDVSNRFYELVLGRSMAYSCAVFPTPDTSLDDAQAEKFDLVCRKLDLRPGQRLLDVGAGWGGLVRHAAAHYGVSAVGVTLSRAQVEWARRANAQAGLDRRSRCSCLTTGISRIVGSTRSPRSGRWSTSVAPSSAATSSRWRLACVPAAGCSTIASPARPPASHTARERSSTATCFPMASCRGRERSSPRCTITVSSCGTRRTSASTTPSPSGNGEPTSSATGRSRGRDRERRARVWRLYMAYSRVGFETDRIQIHQMLGARLDDRGRSLMPLRPTWITRSIAPAPERAELVA